MTLDMDFIFQQKDGSCIFDTNVGGIDFGNNGFGENVLKKCFEYIDLLTGCNVYHNGKKYVIVVGEVMKGIIGYHGSILVKGIMPD